MNKIIAAALFASIFVSACKQKEQPAPESQQVVAAESTVSAAKPAEKPKPAPGYVKNEATYFKLPDASGGELDLAAYAGKPVLVFFYTETCPYCRKAAPYMRKMHETYGPKGLSVLGICTQRGKGPALAFAADFGLKFPMAFNGGETARQYRTQGVPYIFLLDKNHALYDLWEGYDTVYDKPMAKAIEKALAEK